VGKLRLGRVGERGLAWRISYPCLVPHGGFFDAADGLVVAYAHGPASFVMRYEDPSVDGAATLNDNPWIDFTANRPVLLASPRSISATRQGGSIARRKKSSGLNTRHAIADRAVLNRTGFRGSLLA
jgi:hypothetical protein